MQERYYNCFCQVCLLGLDLSLGFFTSITSRLYLRIRTFEREDADAKLSDIFNKACVGSRSAPGKSTVQHILGRFQFHGCYRPRPQVGSEDHSSSSSPPRLPSRYLSGNQLVYSSCLTIPFFPTVSGAFLDFSLGSQILKEIRPDLSEFKCGLAHLFCESH